MGSTRGGDRLLSSLPTLGGSTGVFGTEIGIG